MAGPVRYNRPEGSYAIGATNDRPKYWAFISYSHKDQRWATWLQRSLERYRLPATVRAKRKDLPARLFPVFLDRESLPAAQSLPDRLRDALASSQSLIVVCSPNAVASDWVAQEIRHYRELQPAARILPVIVDGVPGARRAGADPMLECFPRDAVDPGGGEPLAADLRPGKDGRRNALLKLVAGALDLELEALTRRDRGRRQRRVALLCTLLIAAVLAAVFWKRRIELQNRLSVEASRLLAGLNTTDTGQSETERDLLWELATCEDAVRELCIERLLDSPATRQRFLKHPEYGVHALVGLNPAWRQAVLDKLVAPVIRNPDVAPGRKAACAWLIALLEVEDASHVDFAVATAAGWVADARDANALQRIAYFVWLLRSRLTPERSARIRRAVAPQLLAVKDEVLLGNLGGLWHTPPHTPAAPEALAAFGKFLDAIADGAGATRESYIAQASALEPLLLQAAALLAEPDIGVAARETTDALLRSRNVSGTLERCLLALLARAPPAAAEASIRRFVEVVEGKSTNLTWYLFLGDAVEASAGRLEPAARVAICRELLGACERLETSKAYRDAGRAYREDKAKGDSEQEALAELASRASSLHSMLGGAAAAVRPQDAPALFLELTRRWAKLTEGGRTLARCLALRLQPAEAARQFRRLARELDPAAGAELRTALASQAGEQLKDEETRSLAATLVRAALAAPMGRSVVRIQALLPFLKQIPAKIRAVLESRLRNMLPKCSFLEAPMVFESMKKLRMRIPYGECERFVEPFLRTEWSANAVTLRMQTGVLSALYPVLDPAGAEHFMDRIIRALRGHPVIPRHMILDAVPRELPTDPAVALFRNTLTEALAPVKSSMPFKQPRKGRDLTQLLSSLVNKLSPAAATKVFPDVRLALLHLRDRRQLGWLRVLLHSLAGRLDDAGKRVAYDSLASGLRETADVEVFHALTVSLAELPSDGDHQRLLELLKRPTCVSYSRTSLAWVFEAASEERFLGRFWKLVSWAESQGLDVRTPPTRAPRR